MSGDIGEMLMLWIMGWGPKWERAVWTTRSVAQQRLSIFRGEEGRGPGYEVLGEDGVEGIFCVVGGGAGVVG
jgi:hypothetical protein